MRVSRNVKTAFSLKEVTEITGVNPAMLNFLIRNEYLRPSYREDHDFGERQKRLPRGNAWYCSYRDLMIAKTETRPGRRPTCPCERGTNEIAIGQTLG
jgi:hypothetical protein